MKMCKSCKEENLCTLNIKSIEVDELIEQSICLLNKKGYKTSYCCSGHNNIDIANTYIKFANNYDFKTIPKNFILVKHNTDCILTVNHRIYIDWFVDYNKRDLILKEINNDLLNWVINLPNNNI